MENSSHAKEHLQTTLSFLLHGHMNIWCLLLWSTKILKVIKIDFFLACCSWRRSANTRCWWLGRNSWLHFRHGLDGLNHIDVTWEARRYTEIYTAYCWTSTRRIKYTSSEGTSTYLMQYIYISEHTAFFETTPPHHPLPNLKKQSDLQYSIA